MTPTPVQQQLAEETAEQFRITGAGLERWHKTSCAATELTATILSALLRQAEESQADAKRLRAACELTLLFHSGYPWDAAKSNEWVKLISGLLGDSTGLVYTYAVTTKRLCDTVRAAMQTTGEKI